MANPEELLLLRAALCGGGVALEAWHEFQSMSTGIDYLEGDAFRVLPQLFRNLRALEFEDPHWAGSGVYTVMRGMATSSSYERLRVPSHTCGRRLSTP